jgi:hypothetical protein
LAQLEVTGHYFTVTCFEFVAEFLDGISVDKSTCGFTFCVDGVGDFTCVFAIFIANRVNVAVGCAAAILYGVAEVGDAFASHVEAIFHTGVDSVETIAESVGDTTELSVDILCVETFEKVGAGESTLDRGIAIAVAVTKDTAITKNCEPYEIDKP